MSIITDRRCDGCGEIRPGGDEQWWALTPAGWDGVDFRLDFCDPGCLLKFVRSAAFKRLREEEKT